jgi:type IV secretory pathway TrbL component
VVSHEPSVRYKKWQAAKSHIPLKIIAEHTIYYKNVIFILYLSVLDYNLLMIIFFADIPVFAAVGMLVLIIVSITSGMAIFLYR